MNKLLFAGVAVAAISASAGANAQLFGGGIGNNPLGPEYVITFAANGSISTMVNSVYTTNPGPYDGVDDTYIGVTNDTSRSINHIDLSSSLDIGGFDGDGIAVYAGGLGGNSSDSTGYGGMDAFFTNNLGTSLTVNFLSGGIAGGGGQGYFSLEEAVSLTHPPVVVGTPEPSTWAMMMLGFAGLGYAGYRSRNKKALSIA